MGSFQMNRCVFIDRDGTINIDYGYVYQKDNFVFRKNIINAIKILKRNDYLVIVVTNQSGIARGYYTERDVQLLHEYMNNVLNGYGTAIDAFYYCPHYKGGVVEKYAKECNCRKPDIGMFEKAKHDWDVDLNQSYMIGDSAIDMQAGYNANLKEVFMVNEDNILEIVNRIVNANKIQR